MVMMTIYKFFCQFDRYTEIGNPWWTPLQKDNNKKSNREKWPREAKNKKIKYYKKDTYKKVNY